MITEKGFEVDLYLLAIRSLLDNMRIQINEVLLCATNKIISSLRYTADHTIKVFITHEAFDSLYFALFD
jgi:hypothetical protein